MHLGHKDVDDIFLFKICHPDTPSFLTINMRHNMDISISIVSTSKPDPLRIFQTPKIRSEQIAI
ncbi:hypothetical protein FACS1894199_12650 [Bacteroidia bacterium]|nr:hypothetical protein FACS1894199_12650 [Bacteroidia bacterium]